MPGRETGLGGERSMFKKIIIEPPTGEHRRKLETYLETHLGKILEEAPDHPNKEFIECKRKILDAVLKGWGDTQGIAEELGRKGFKPNPEIFNRAAEEVAKDVAKGAESAEENRLAA